MVLDTCCSNSNTPTECLELLRIEEIKRWIHSNALLLRIPFFSLIDPRIHHRLRDESMCSLLDPSIVEEEVESVMVMVLMSMMKCSATNISRSNIFSLIP